MPKNVVDFSACSPIIYREPWDLHFWECTVEEYFEFHQNPKEFLNKIGIVLPYDCRLETVLINHDWLVARNNPTPTPTPEPGSGPVTICNVGGGGGAVAFYRVTSFAHYEADVGRFAKSLLHETSQQKRLGT